MDSNKRKYKIAICFWGILRSVKYTYQNIIKNIYRPLISYNCELTVFIHTYSIDDVYTNERANDKPIKLNTEEDIKLLNPNFYKIDRQEDFDKSINYELYKKKGDPWNNNFQTFTNLIRALNSLNQLKILIENNKNEEFDAYFVIRPDVIFDTIISEKLLLNSIILKQNKLFIPKFHSWGGCNDRMTIGKWNSIKIYLSRFIYALEYSLTKTLHSEIFLKDWLIKNNIKILLLDIIFRRIRTDGSVYFMDKNKKLK